MKNILDKTLSAVFITSVLISANVSAVSPASFTLSSNSSVANGSTFSVSIFENGDNVNVVTSKLGFDSTKLQLLSATCGSSFPNPIGETGGVTCYTSGAVVNGNVLVASVSFKALVGSGTSTISMTSGSQIASGGSNIWNNTSGSTIVSLVTPTPAPNPAPTPTPNPTPVLASSTTTTPATASAPKSTGLTNNSSKEDTASVTPAATSNPVLGSSDVKVAAKPVADNQSVKKSNSDNSRLYDIIRLIAAVIIAAGITIAVIMYFYRSQVKALFKTVKKSSKKLKSKIKKSYFVKASLKK